MKANAWLLIVSASLPKRRDPSSGSVRSVMKSRSGSFSQLIPINASSALNPFPTLVVMDGVFEAARPRALGN